jgi:FixJ family two-component response regulator
MPESLSGRDLADRLRALRPDLKIVFMSGYSPEIVGKNTEFFRKTRCHFLQKPFSANLLIQTVRDCLDGR